VSEVFVGEKIKDVAGVIIKKEGFAVEYKFANIEVVVEFVGRGRRRVGGFLGGLFGGLRIGGLRIGRRDNISVLLSTRFARLLNGDLSSERSRKRSRFRFRDSQRGKLIDKIIRSGLLSTRLALLLRGIRIDVLLGARDLRLRRKISLAPSGDSLAKNLIGLLSRTKPSLIESLLLINGREDTKTLKQLLRSGFIKETGILNGRDEEETELHELGELSRKIGLLLLGRGESHGASGVGHRQGVNNISGGHV
jgi:hypothetical protein